MANDAGIVGTTVTFTISAVSNGVTVTDDVAISFIHECDGATIDDPVLSKNILFALLELSTDVLTFDGVSDSVSDNLGTPYSCGQYTYTLRKDSDDS